MVKGNDKKPRCKLIGVDSNVYVLAGTVRQTLIDAGQRENAKAFVDRLPNCSDYSEAIALMEEYVTIY